jgi:hypothetical protein
VGSSPSEPQFSLSKICLQNAKMLSRRRLAMPHCASISCGRAGAGRVIDNIGHGSSASPAGECRRTPTRRHRALRMKMSMEGTAPGCALPWTDVGSSTRVQRACVAAQEVARFEGCCTESCCRGKASNRIRPAISPPASISSRAYALRMPGGPAGGPNGAKSRTIWNDEFTHRRMRLGTSTACAEFRATRPTCSSTTATDCRTCGRPTASRNSA